MTDQLAETNELATDGTQDSAALDNVLDRYQPAPAPSGDLDNLLLEYSRAGRGLEADRGNVAADGFDPGALFRRRSNAT